MSFKFTDQSLQLLLLDKMLQDLEVFRPFCQAFNRSNNSKIDSSSNNRTMVVRGIINRSNMAVNSKTNKLTWG